MSDGQHNELLNWTFNTDEISAGVYKVVAKHRLGPSVEKSGTDPEELMRQIQNDAKIIEQDLLRRK